MYEVRIVELATRKVVKRFEPKESERAADLLERGVSINLNHDLFYTEVVKLRRKPKS